MSVPLSPSFPPLPFFSCQLLVFDRRLKLRTFISIRLVITEKTRLLWRRFPAFTIHLPQNLFHGINLRPCPPVMLHIRNLTLTEKVSARSRYSHIVDGCHLKMRLTHVFVELERTNFDWTQSPRPLHYTRSSTHSHHIHHNCSKKPCTSLRWIYSSSDLE